MRPQTRISRRTTIRPGVWKMPEDHPSAGGTLFPKSVVDVDADFSDRLLVSGVNNRKIGRLVTKGRFKGYHLYGLSLEERATCPSSCAMRAQCYGNGMPFARRHRITDEALFFDVLRSELDLLARRHGVLVRLHVLGDFPSHTYVERWGALLDEYDSLACYGYTHYRPDFGIGSYIAALKDDFPERFRIRWSDVSGDDGATVIQMGEQASGIPCPAQTQSTECCSTCALCWDFRKEITFVEHGNTMSGRKPKFKGDDDEVETDVGNTGQADSTTC